MFSSHKIFIERKARKRIMVKSKKLIMEKSRKHRKRIRRRSINSVSMPLDLVIEIFTRLPAKSLMRFKCLSKQYSSIIESQNFVDSFFSYSSSQRPPRMLLGAFNSKEVVLYSATTHSDEDQLVIPRHVMTFPKKDLWFDSPPVRGLLCYSVGSNQHVICNLATRQLFHLPQNEAASKDGDFVDEYLFFGYEPISNRFKVVSILMKKNHEQQCWILTVGDGVISSWRKIQYIPCLPGVYLSVRLYTICINGVLYYIVESDDDTTITRVVSFDLKTEEFNLIKLPPGVKEVTEELVDFQGKIAFIECLDEEEIRIWVLENAEKHQWSSKSYKLPLNSLNLELEKLGICEGEIVFIQPYKDDQVYTLHFNLDKETLRKVEIEMPSNYDEWYYISMNHFDNLLLL